MLSVSRSLIFVVPLVACVALGSAILSVARSNQVAAAPEQRVKEWSSSRVAGVGVVEPEGKAFRVATPVSGVVKSVYVEPGQSVRRGELLFALDDNLLQASRLERLAALRNAELDLAATVAELVQLNAETEADAKSVEIAQAELDEAEDALRTVEQLAGGSVSKRELNSRRNSVRSARAKLQEAQSRLAASAAKVRLIDPQTDGATYLAQKQKIEQARASLGLVDAELSQLQVRAPQDGTVLEVNIKPGEFAAAGFEDPKIILGKLDPLNLRVEIDEADVPRLPERQFAWASRRGVTSERIKLDLVRIEPSLTQKTSFTSDQNERVDTRVLQLVYRIDAAQLRLRTGQLLDVTIANAANVNPTADLLLN